MGLIASQNLCLFSRDMIACQVVVHNGQTIKKMGLLIDNIIAIFLVSTVSQYSQNRCSVKEVLVGSNILTAEEAKSRVFDPETWGRMNSLASRRFPNDSAMADEALSDLLERLAEDDWQRVRQWKGKSSFTGFLATIAARCFTDFVRARFGHIRPPKDIKRESKNDPLWLFAYEQLITRSQSKTETIELMLLKAPSRTREQHEVIVSGVLACNPSRPMFKSPTESFDALANPDAICADGDQNTPYLNQDINVSAAVLDGDIEKIAEQLDSKLKLSSEDYLFLKMRFEDGFGVQKIAQRLGIEGDPFRRYHRIIDHLREVYSKAGLVDDLEGVSLNE